ncbi:hypothetical protein MMC17_009571 [Xylographa soralifera]|nr:hypothetical protein [Xylographa soralifera]
MTRAPRRSGKDKRIEELEKKLKSMEDLMKRPVSNQQAGINGAEFGNDSRRPQSPAFSSQSEAGTSNLSFSLDPAFKIASENSQASDFDLPSPEASFSAVARSQRDMLPRASNFDNDISEGRAIKALPPKDRMHSLVEESFQGFHPSYPLFDKARFMSVFDSLDTSVNDPGRWACLNVVLALTHQFQHGTDQDMKEDCETWSYFEAAFAVVGQLMTMHVTLWSVQALLGMALVIQGTPNQGPVSLLISGAMKLAHRMGLHKQCQNPNVSAAEIEERKRVFWIAYSLDKDLSLQMGQPSAQDDDDMDVELPSEIDSSLVYPGDSIGMNFFNFRARLAMIQGQIYKRLYSVKATKQAVAERVVAATELEAMLQLWRASVPTEFMQDYYEPFLQMPTSDTVRHPIILQLLYFNSLAIIYSSLPALPSYRELQGTEDPMDVQLLSAPLIYAAEARKAIKLLQVTPRRRHACIWAVLHIFVTAATTLLNHVVCDPSNPLALSDLKLIEPLLTLLGVLAKSSKGRKSERISGMHRSCMELFERANAAIESTNLTDMDWDQFIMSDPSQERESMEDFLRRMENISSGYDVELDSIPPGVSRDFAVAVEQQFRESTSI